MFTPLWGMRKATYFAMTTEDALALVDRAATMHLASTGDRGQPILRALHVVRMDGALYFHAAPVGEKTEATKASGISKLVMSEATNFPELAAFYQEEVVNPGREFIRRILQRGVE